MKKELNDINLSIILPTYNESKNIILLIEEIIRQLKDKPLSYEIIVADDDSPDRTWEMAKEFAILSDPELVEGESKDLAKRKIRVIRRLSDHGLARSILEGINNAQGKNILVMDSDFNHDPKMIWQMYKLLEFYDLVVGSRFVPGGGMEDKTRNKLSFLYNLFVRILLGTHVQDNLSGFFAIKKTMLMPFATKEMFGGYGEYFIRLLFRARKKGYTIIEVPVFYKLRPHGKSKSNFLKMIREYSLAAVNELKSEVKLTGTLRSIFNR